MRNAPGSLLLILAALGLGCAHAPPAAGPPVSAAPAPAPQRSLHGVFAVSVPPRPTDRYASAEWSLYVPAGVARLAGVIVHQHGCGRNGIEVPYDLHWRALADAHGMALMGSWLRPKRECLDWNDPALGSNDAFVEALGLFARVTSHPELAQIPWALWGHSGGAGWVVRMTGRHPGRVIATVAKSLCQEVRVPEATLTVPVLVLTGPKDFPKCLDESRAAFAAHRAKGGRWALVVEPNGDHDTREQRLLAIPYLDAALRVWRAGSAGGADSTGSTKSAPQPWLHDATTGDVAADSVFPGDRRQASWLPDEPTARRFAEFVRTATIVDTTPPATAPTAIRVERKGGDVTLTCEARPDLESGLKTIVVYRDGARIGTWKGPESKRNPGHVQRGNYGDEPEPVRPELSYTDKAVPPGTHRYELASVNFSDLESPKSAPVQVDVPAAP
jgi:hypothetical protein